MSGRPPVPEPLPHPVVDNHCHLDMSLGSVDSPWPVDEALARAASVGVTRIVQIGCDLAGARWAVSAAQEYAAIVAGVALHPNEAPRLGDGLDAAIEEIESLVVGEPRVRAGGETGLDYYRTGPDGIEAQLHSFRVHIAMAKQHGRTLVVHDRDAHDDVLRILDADGAPDRVVMHCFSGDVEFATACVERGFWLSFAGTVTFKNAPRLREALGVTPLNRVLVETDAPYLAPMPHRGRPNASYLVPLTVRAMAETLDCDLESLCRRIDANTDAAFGGRW
jgi:TatD DNase family protein